MSITKEIKLICSDVGDNANKVWIGELHDDDTVITRWGRVGYDMQSKSFPSAGESFLLKKEREKIKKGYTYPRILAGSAGAIGTIKSDSLGAIAKQQLAKNKPELSRLIDRLVQANVHNITSNTNITYNAASGLFQTPLGIVTQEGIDEARGLLVSIKKCLKNNCGDKEFKSLVSNYLMIVPQNIGMRIDVKVIFPDEDSVKKQADILDSLEASYKAVMTNPVTPSGAPAQVEQVFQVDLDVCSDDKVRDRLIGYYEKTKKRMHGYDHIKIREIYSVTIMDMLKSFSTDGKKIGNLTEVYHGTSQANLLSILKSGLKVSPPSTAYIAGKMFGNGVYGAINSSKSLGYTFGRWGGSNSGDSGWLFVCDFAMGKVYEPTGRCQEPARGFDSVWAKADKCGLNHDELIVYKNQQVNIKYLLECK
jgi:poly [ADP-ribose] polymerase